MKWTDKNGIERCNCDESHKRIAQLEARCRDYETMLRQIAKGDYDYVSTATALAEATLSAYASEREAPHGTYPTPAEGWTCFHCGMHFDGNFKGWQEALHHFGENVQGDAWCQYTARQVRAMEALLRSYQEEDTPRDRHLHKIQAEHATALRRAEETGYARGVTDRTAEFKNFHRLLCERFGYGHDPIDWQRDQLSLIEHIAGLTFTVSKP